MTKPALTKEREQQLRSYLSLTGYNAGELFTEIDRLREVNSELLAALKITEWTPSSVEGVYLCNCCGRQQWNGHNSVCRVAAAIARAEKEG